MGPYICLASNGILPSVSKRVLLKVQCKYSVDHLLLFNYTSFPSYLLIHFQFVSKKKQLLSNGTFVLFLLSFTLLHFEYTLMTIYHQIRPQLGVSRKVLNIFTRERILFSL